MAKKPKKEKIIITTISADSPAVKRILYLQNRIFLLMRDKGISPSGHIQFLEMFLKSKMKFSVLEISSGVMDAKSAIKIDNLKEEILKKICDGSLNHLAYRLLLVEFRRLLIKSPSFHDESHDEKDP